MNKGQYFDKHRNLQLEMQELERKWRLYYDEQRLLEAALQARNIVGMSPMSSGGGAIVNSPIYLIQSYTAGTSTIDFTNNGGDDWNIDFKITPDTVQSTANIVGYHYDVEHWISGVVTALESGFKTTDYSYNAVGNGAGVYQIDQTYIFDDNSIFRVTSLYKVNSIGVVVAFVSANGVSVNNTNGLIINATAHYTEYGVSYPLIWASYDNLPPSSLNVLGNTTTINANVPIDSIGIGYFHALDSVFTDDYAGNTGSVASIVIS